MSDGAGLVPGRLRTARQLRRMTGCALAEAIDVAPSTVTAWEKGRREPEPHTLRRLANELRVPLRYLQNGEDVGPVDTPDVFFRRLRRTAAADRDQARALATAVEQIHEILQRYVEVPDLEVPQYPLSGSGEDPDDGFATPAQAAAECRRTWGMGGGPIPNMVDPLEVHGIWVSMLGGTLAQEIDAFSYWRDGWAHVLLNPAKKDAYRSRFDAAHELGHLVMHGQGSCGSEAEVEKEANEFASAFLMPSTTWQAEAPRSTNPRHYLEWKSRWKVSVAAMLFRSRTLEILDERKYKSAMVRYSQLGWRSGEPGMEHVPPEQPQFVRGTMKALAGHGIDTESLREQLGLPPDLMDMAMGTALAGDLSSARLRAVE